ncbi:MAG: BREX-4 system phosphatase PglZ [Selenomonadaceae bacterium]|nr:BREX-4 system phosphatase PglZ [Selenomonadaceae bacterium]
MECRELTECLAEIRAYLQGETMGFSLLVNTENYGDYRTLWQRLTQDGELELVLVSNFCSPQGLPSVEAACSAALLPGKHVLTGVSQTWQLRGQESLARELAELVGRGTRGHTVILLEHCAAYLQKLIEEDLRLERRILLWVGHKSPLPWLRAVAPETAGCLSGVKGLIGALEKCLWHREEPEELIFATKLAREVFADSLYPLRQEGNIFAQLKQRYPELTAVGITEADGTKENWRWLCRELDKGKSLTALTESYFGEKEQLSWRLPMELEEPDRERNWFYWLSLKLYPPSGTYFRLALGRSQNLAELEQEIYLALLDVSWEEKSFVSLYRERKKVLARLSAEEKISAYADKVGRWDKAAIHYLSEDTAAERYRLLKCLELYPYSQEELAKILPLVAPNLALYLQSFSFTAYHTFIDMEKELLALISAYFTDYKWQKVKNKLYPDFLQRVEGFAVSRPYNKFLTRVAVLKKLTAPGTTPYFFDALGVEYLSFIVAKCEKMGLTATIGVARCELPSITSRNKDFYQLFPEGRVRKISALDECKHHSSEFDYTKRKEPLHLFAELAIIEGELKKIYQDVKRNNGSALIVSDHGASRLAVINEQENPAIELAEKGQHSGRCAPVSEDPHLPQVTHENGFAVMAGYDRFRGGRKADVEVHGGASLEEVLVPIIRLQLRSEKAEYRLVEETLPFKPGQDAKLLLFCDRPMKTPCLKIGEKLFSGEFTIDKQHANFTLTGIRRKGKYEAAVYEGSASQGVVLPFEIKGQTREEDLGI